MNSADLVAQLRKAADEMRAEDQNGWPVTCDEAADCIEALEAAEAERDRLREAGSVVLASWDERMPDGPEQYKTNDELGFSYWTPSASMVPSEAMSKLRAALQKEPQP